jgi:hypothetical protein
VYFERGDPPVTATRSPTRYLSSNRDEGVCLLSARVHGHDYLILSFSTASKSRRYIRPLTMLNAGVILHYCQTVRCGSKFTCIRIILFRKVYVTFRAGGIMSDESVPRP